MNHSFLCLPGHNVYPSFAYMSHTGDHDFDRFLRLTLAGSYEALTFTASTA